MKMKKSIIYALCSMLFVVAAQATTTTMPLVGFYRTVDDSTNKSKAIVRLYECGENLCGRVVALFDKETGTTIEETIKNPGRRAEKVNGTPHVDGLDIIWGMSWDARRSEFSGGRIMDPEDGRTYRARIWANPNDPTLLNVRGMIGPFGRTQVWHAVATADLHPDLKNLDTSGWTPVTR